MVTGLLLVQNAWGWNLAACWGWIPYMGLLAGSITLSGGHGTRGGLGLHLHREVRRAIPPPRLAIACATFGLVLGASSAARWPVIW